jgi:hypothetical protein
LRACPTVTFLLVQNLNKVGAMSAMLCPSSHGSFQNFIFCRSPREKTTAELKRSLALSSIWSGRCSHGFASSFQVCHSQRTLKARPLACKSGIPSPPYSFGLQIAPHITKQLPPFAISSLFQRKPRRSLSIALMSQIGGSMTYSWKIIMATTPLFHPLTFPASLSNAGWRSTFLRLRSNKGMPK